MERISKKSLVFLIGIASLILPILDRSFFSVVSEHSFFETVLAGIVFVISSLIATILPISIINPKIFKNNYLKFIVIVPLIFFILIWVIQPRWANDILNVLFGIVVFPIFVVIDMLYYLSPLFFLLIVFLAPYLLSKYLHKSKNAFAHIVYLILYTYTNWVITMSIWTIIYFE